MRSRAPVSRPRTPLSPEEAHRRKVAQQQRVAVGHAFEVWITDQHRHAVEAKLLHHPVHNEPRVVRRGRELVYASPVAADFTATLDGGLSLALEAKSHDAEGGPRFYRKKIPQVQLDHLDATDRAGGLALLAFEVRHKLEVVARYVMPWRLVPWTVASSAWGLEPEHCAGWEASTTLYLTRFVGRCPTCGRLAIGYARPPASPEAAGRWCCGRPFIGGCH